MTEGGASADAEGFARTQRGFSWQRERTRGGDGLTRGEPRCVAELQGAVGTESRAGVAAGRDLEAKARELEGVVGASSAGAAAGRAAGVIVR